MYTLVERRIISGTGNIRLPRDKNIRQFLLYMRVIRPPQNPAFNNEWEPPKTLYARMSAISNSYVIDSKLIEFDKVLFNYVEDVSGQTLIALNCAYEGILSSFVDLATCIIECVPIAKTNLTDSMYALQTSPDTVVFKMFKNTGIELQLYKLEYEKCGIKELPPLPPPPPPNGDTPVDFDEPLQTSPPYDDDDPFTKPAPLDEEDDGGGDPNPELPFGDRCVAYEFSTFWVDSRDGSFASRPTVTIWGEILEVIQTPAGSTGPRFVNVSVRAFGNVSSPCRTTPVNTGLGAQYVEEGSLRYTITEV